MLKIIEMLGKNKQTTSTLVAYLHLPMQVLNHKKAHWVGNAVSIDGYPKDQRWCQPAPPTAELCQLHTGFTNIEGHRRDPDCTMSWMKELILKRDISLSMSLPAQMCCLPDIPVTSSGRFLRAVTTGPSFLRRRGLLRLSATFCFSLDRNFRLGSDAEQKKKKETVFWLILFQYFFSQQKGCVAVQHLQKPQQN